MPHRLLSAICCFICFLPAPWLTAQEHVASEGGESPLRWSEGAYGISLTPPPGTLQWEGPSVLWAAPAGYSVSFELATSETRFNLEQVAQSAMVQMGFARSFPRLAADESGQPQKPRQERIANRPAIRMYFDVTEDDGTEWLYGQAIVMLEPFAAAVIKVNAPRHAAEEGRAAFEDVLDSLHVPFAEELDEIRGRLIEAGEAWLQTLTPEDLRRALPAEQFYRLREGDRDLGYIRLGSTSDPAVLEREGYESQGTLVRQFRREYLDTLAVDTVQEIFASDDGLREVWSLKSTVRPGGPAPSTRGLPRQNQSTPTMTWAQTGVRGDQEMAGRSVNAITVITESPPASDAAEQIQKHERFLGRRTPLDLKGQPQIKEWQAPEKAYLPQIMLSVFPAMLPAEDVEYAFTAYHPATGEPALRTVRVIVQPDGHRLVIDRPTPRSSPLRHLIDAEGNLVYTQFANGILLQPATPGEIARAWGTTLPTP